MKFGYHTESWGFGLPPDIFPTVLEEISKAGFDGFETHAEDVLPYLGNKKKFLEMTSEKGLQLASIHLSGLLPAIEGFHPVNWLNRKIWQTRWIPKILKFASSVGCKRAIIIGGLLRKKGPKEKDFLTTAKILNKYGKLCEEIGLEASYHPFYFNTLISQRDQLSKLYELTDPDLVHLTIDIGHCARNGCDPAEIIRSYRDMINHVHFRDISEDGVLVQIGDGIIDLKSIHELLKSIRYQDWIIVEHDWILLERAKTSPVESTRKAGKFIKTLRALP